MNPSFQIFFKGQTLINSPSLCLSLSDHRGNFMDTLSRPYKRGAPCSACPGHCKAKKLCTNSCPYGDLWINCKELDAAYHDWLCNTKTKEGLERFRFCRATCSCKDAITYP